MITSETVKDIFNTLKEDYPLGTYNYNCGDNIDIEEEEDA